VQFSNPEALAVDGSDSVNVHVALGRCRDSARWHTGHIRQRRLVATLTLVTP
jgi:hypothetical protein